MALSDFIKNILVMDRYDTILWDNLKDNSDNITMNERIKILQTISEAAYFIQSKGYCHLDLKPSNIFINLNNGKWDRKTLKIADFGLCRNNSDLVGRMGTPGFGSPEQFDGHPHLKSDNFAVGKMAIMILHPWQIAWNLMAQPLTEAEYNNHPAKNDQICRQIADLLKVSI